MHESAHYEIMNLHGCMNSDWGFEGMNIRIKCVEWSHNDLTWLRQEAYLQSQAEIVGYHLSPFLLFFLGWLVFSWAKGDR